MMIPVQLDYYQGCEFTFEDTLKTIRARRENALIHLRNASDNVQHVVYGILNYAKNRSTPIGALIEMHMVTDDELDELIKKYPRADFFTVHRAGNKLRKSQSEFSNV